MNGLAFDQVSLCAVTNRMRRTDGPAGWARRFGLRADGSRTISPHLKHAAPLAPRAAL